MIICSIRDRVSGEYGTPCTFVNLDDAKRRIAQAFVQNPFSKDLEVYQIGVFDPVKGLIRECDDKDFLFTVSVLIAEMIGDNNA